MAVYVEWFRSIQYTGCLFHQFADLGWVGFDLGSLLRQIFGQKEGLS